MQTFQSLLDQFIQLNQFPPLSLQNTGRCLLMVDNQLPVYLQVVAEEQAFCFYSIVGRLDRESFHKQLQLEVISRANYLWLGTQGMTLSLAPDGAQITLAYKFSVENIDVSLFTQKFEQFVDQGLGWQARLSEGVAAVDNPKNKSSSNNLHELKV